MQGDKIFIVGANGQLGLALRDQYPRARFADVNDLDITDSESIRSFDWSGIEVIINSAAYTNVDGAETNRDLCMKINSDGVTNLAKVANQYDLTLVHISSDYVFDGTKDNHTEEEEFSPLSVYGESKAEGDKQAMTAKKYYLLRTSWVIGEGHNFVRTMMDLANKNISPTVVNDQIGRLTFTSELVRAIDHLLNAKIQRAMSMDQRENAKPIDINSLSATSNLQSSIPFGTYNVSNSGKPASWAEITRQIFKILGRDDLKVTDISTKEYYKGKDNIAPRPLKSTLCLDKIIATGFEPRDWQDDLACYIKNSINNRDF